MKKLIVFFSVLAIAGRVSAQNSAHDIHITKATESTTKIGPGQVVFAGANTTEGANNLTKAGVGRLQFTKRGNVITNVTFIDNAGNTFNLKPEPGTTASLPAGNWEVKVNTKTKLYRFFGDAD